MAFQKAHIEKMAINKLENVFKLKAREKLFKIKVKQDHKGIKILKENFIFFHLVLVFGVNLVVLNKNISYS